VKNNINSHFRRESKVMVWFLISPIVLGILIAILYPYYLIESKIDACLDSGGSFDYAACKCDYISNHEYKENNKCK